VNEILMQTLNIQKPDGPLVEILYQKKKPVGPLTGEVY
jgi:hypothetical protein